MSNGNLCDPTVRCGVSALDGPVIFLAWQVVILEHDLESWSLLAPSKSFLDIAHEQAQCVLPNQETLPLCCLDLEDGIVDPGGGLSNPVNLQQTVVGTLNEEIQEGP